MVEVFENSMISDATFMQINFYIEQKLSKIKLALDVLAWTSNITYSKIGYRMKHFICFVKVKQFLPFKAKNPE
jgi:hypothetical protein